MMKYQLRTIFLVRKGRNTHSGGVALYVRNDIRFIKRLDLACELESISIDVKLPFMKPLIFTALYPPSPGVPIEIFNLIDNLFYRLDDEKRNASQSETSVAILLNLQRIVSNTNRIYRKHNLSQLIDEPTRTTSDTSTLMIDCIVTNKPICVSESGVIHCGISDHDVIFAIRCARLPEIKNQPRMIRVRKYSKFDNDAFLNDLKYMNFDQIKNITDDPKEMRGL